MATDRGGGEVDGSNSDDCKRDIGPGLKSPLVPFLYCKNGLRTNSLMYIRIHISCQIHSLRVICVVSDIGAFPYLICVCVSQTQIEKKTINSS